MESREYQTLFDLESSYWWFRALRAVLLDICRQLGLDRSSRILDVGCGTGKNVEVLRREVSSSTYGCDISNVAARYWPLRDLRKMCLGSVNDIPFRDQTFDAVFCVDVLECDGVVEERACEELWRVTRGGGYLVIVVPSYKWLLNSTHHRAVHAARRYTRSELSGALARFPGQLVRMTFLFATMLLPIAVYRFCQNLCASRHTPRSDLRRLPRMLNEVLFRVVDGERRLVFFVDLPFGSSLLAVVQKS